MHKNWRDWLWIGFGVWSAFWAMYYRGIDSNVRVENDLFVALVVAPFFYGTVWLGVGLFMAAVSAKEETGPFDRSFAIAAVFVIIIGLVMRKI